MFENTVYIVYSCVKSHTSHTPLLGPPSQVYVKSIHWDPVLVEVAMPVSGAAMPGAVASERCEPGEPAAHLFVISDN